MTHISNDLIEAYKGYYEDEIEHDRKTHSAPCSPGEYPTYWAKCKIQSHTPKERLEVYLTWNGIIGYTNRIYEIATGEL